MDGDAHINYHEGSLIMFGRPFRLLLALSL